MDIKKFLKKAFESESSILIFFRKDLKNEGYLGDENSERQYDYIIIKKNPILGLKTVFSENFIVFYNSNNDNFNIEVNIKTINSSIIDKLSKIKINEFDFNNYYKLISKEDFSQQLYNIIFINKDNYYWKKTDFYGLIIEQKQFVQKFSDFGSDNTQSYIYANSYYFGFNKNRVFEYHLKPNDYGTFKLKDVQVLGENLFKYFYDDKLYLVTNFDTIELSTFSKIFYENKRHFIEDKKYLLPADYLSNAFILSNQIQRINRDKGI